MIQQLLRYHQSQPHFVRVKAPLQSERIPVAGLLGGIALTLGTPANAEVRPIGSAYQLLMPSTQMVPRQKDGINAKDALIELKMTSDLTWSQIARLLGVSRTRVHSWTEGGKIRGNNQAKIQDLLEQVRSMADLPKFKIRNALIGRTSTIDRGVGPLLISDNTPPRHRQNRLIGSLTTE
ncbi:hypothetical protein EUU23_12410 [Sphingorhabdus sp. IMCC26285]|uniref:Helix-turn-helix domain-containing protein n=1 Tax=Sphingorhabdus profundilacus TaxID=2509718 RepID=A0A6I4LY63_9SPHN|nr:hypothetical protein [Sphingorhabdus profundilacus]MVZ98497.1 hypothetical protein [Sphingorhabdus profundilacus]